MMPIFSGLSVAVCCRPPTNSIDTKREQMTGSMVLLQLRIADLPLRIENQNEPSRARKPALFINPKSEPRITRINADNFGSGRGALTYKVSLFHIRSAPLPLPKFVLIRVIRGLLFQNL